MFNSNINKQQAKFNNPAAVDKLHSFSWGNLSPVLPARAVQAGSSFFPVLAVAVSGNWNQTEAFTGVMLLCSSALTILALASFLERSFARKRPY